MKMYIVAVGFAFAITFVTGKLNRTKDEWKTDIGQLCSDLTETYNAKDFTALREYYTADFLGFHPGALGAVGFDGIDKTRHYINEEQVKVRWVGSDFAVIEYQIQQESSEGVQQLEHVLAVIVDENGKLKFALALWNFV